MRQCLSIIHKVLKSVQMNIKVYDGNGVEHQPREWFVVPFSIVENIIQRVLDGTIVNYIYNPKQQCLEKQVKKTTLSYNTNSDIDWSSSIGEIDEQLYKKYGLEKDEIEFIERTIKAME